MHSCRKSIFNWIALFQVLIRSKRLEDSSSREQPNILQANQSYDSAAAVEAEADRTEERTAEGTLAEGTLAEGTPVEDTPVEDTRPVDKRP